MFSRQASIGVSKVSKHRMYAFSLEGYYKTMDHVIEYREYVSPFSGAGASWDQLREIGKGAQLWRRTITREKERDHSAGWIGYTLSCSLTREIPGCADDGKPFSPYKCDRRHDSRLLLTQRLGKRWGVVRWLRYYRSALTLPTASYEGVGDPSPLRSAAE